MADNINFFLPQLLSTLTDYISTNIQSMRLKIVTSARRAASPCVAVC